MTVWLHTYQPSPILIDLGFISIHWYGLILTLAIAAGFLVAKFLFKKYQLSPNHLFDLLFYLVIFGLIGARVYHVLNELPYYWQNPGEIIAVWNGGLALHGAMIAGGLALFIYIRKNFHKLYFAGNNNQETITKKTPINNNQNSNSSRIGKWKLFGIWNLEFGNYLVFVVCFLVIADILAPALALGQAIGRWGNYFNQELYGLPCDLAWCIPIGLESRMPGFESFAYFHPTFLYESLASLLIFFALIYAHSHRLKRHAELVAASNLEIPKQVRNDFNYKLPITDYRLLSRHGSIFAFYLILYSITRILTELIRIDRTPLVLGVRLPIIFSILLIVAGLFILWYIYSVWKKRT